MCLPVEGCWSCACRCPLTQTAHPCDRQAYKEFEEVEKQEYHLAEHPSDEFDEDFEFQTVDLRDYHGTAEQRAAFCGRLGRAFEDTGFAVLVGHGVDPLLYERTHASTREFFEAPSLVEKERFHAQRVGSVKQGYFPYKQTSNMHPDLVEGWVFCRRAFRMPGGAAAGADLGTLWPRPDQEPAFRELVQVKGSHRASRQSQSLVQGLQAKSWCRSESLNCF